MVALPASRGNVLEPAHHASEDEQQDRAERREADGTQVELAGADGAPAEQTADHASDECADDTEEDGDDTAGRIAPRDEELRQ